MGILKRLFGRPDRNLPLTILQRDLDLINESAAIMEKTSNPETFFSRYDFYMEKLALMAERESTGVRGVKFGGESFISKFEKMSSGKLRIETINDFIDRMWADTCQKAEKLKTDNGKQNRYQKFYSDLQQYDGKMPPECIQHYRSLSASDVAPNRTVSPSSAGSTPQPATEKSGLIDRRKIPSEEIDRMQRIEASEKYRKKIYRRFYRGYPEMPYISQDREFNTQWLEHPGETVERRMMTRYPDGLLPGHVYMLYWLGKNARRRIPVYFEYRYGIDFEKERLFLIENRYIDADNHLTELGKEAMERHKEVIEERHPQPLHRSSATNAVPQQEQPHRAIPERAENQLEAIPASDIQLLHSEMEYLNDVLRSVCELAHIPQPLSLELSDFVFSTLRTGTHYSWTPYTPSGKTAKYPLVLHYQSAVPERSANTEDAEYEAWLDFLDKGGTTEEWEAQHGKLKEEPLSTTPNVPDESFGEVYYLQNGLIGKARLIFWRDHVGYFIHLGQTKGALALKMVIQCKPPEEIILYKE